MDSLIDKTLAALNEREESRIDLIEKGELTPEAARACAMIGVINNLLGRDVNGVGPLAVALVDGGKVVGYQKAAHYKGAADV